MLNGHILNLTPVRLVHQEGKDLAVILRFSRASWAGSPAAALAVLGLCTLSGCDRDTRTKSETSATEVGAVDAGKKSADSVMQRASEATSRKDFSSAFTLYREAADLGSAEAMYRVGRMYEEGLGIRQDWNSSKDWIKRAAENGHPRAQASHLAFRYEVYKGQKESEENVSFFSKREDLTAERLKTAIEDLERLSAAGISEATVALAELIGQGLRVKDGAKGVAVLLQRDQPRALKLLVPLAEGGDTQAQLSLMEWGLHEPTAVPNGSEKWMELAGKSSDPAVVLSVANSLSAKWPSLYIHKPLHLRGKALSVDEANKESVRWYERASQLGSAKATFELGAAYIDGRGVYKDEKKGFELQLRAAQDGSVDGQREVSRSYASGRGVVKDWSKSYDWVMKAATHPTASDYSLVEPQRWLSSLYLFGLGVDKDVVLAYAWANVAASSGDEAAVKLRQQIEGQLTRDQVAEAQALSSKYKVGDRIVRTTGGSGDSQQSGSSAPTSAGTGFFVSSDGHVLTNAHVVEGCRTIRLPALDVTANAVVVDKVNDLAIVKASGSGTRPVAKLQAGEKVKQGQEIVVFGFPLSGFLPAAGNITPGVIAALAGPGNNAGLIQITAPIQQGNSGGPVLDRKGNVVGVVVGKADAIRVAKATGDIPQNVNFAVSVATVRSFLTSNGIPYSTPSMFSLGKDATELAGVARNYTFKVECLK
jgi:TPR repeat protein